MSIEKKVKEIETVVSRLQGELLEMYFAFCGDLDEFDPNDFRIFVKYFMNRGLAEDTANDLVKCEVCLKSERKSWQ